MVNNKHQFKFAHRGGGPITLNLLDQVQPDSLDDNGEDVLPGGGGGAVVHGHDDEFWVPGDFEPVTETMRSKTWQRSCKFQWSTEGGVFSAVPSRAASMHSSIGRCRPDPLQRRQEDIRIRVAGGREGEASPGAGELDDAKIISNKVLDWICRCGSIQR